MSLAPSQHKPGGRNWGRGGRKGKKEEEVGEGEEKGRERERKRGTELRRKGSVILTTGFREGALQVPLTGETSADCLPQAPARPLASQLEQNIWQSAHSPQVYCSPDSLLGGFVRSAPRSASDTVFLVPGPQVTFRAHPRDLGQKWQVSGCPESAAFLEAVQRDSGVLVSLAW